MERKANFVSIAFGSSEGTRSQFTIDQLLQFTDALDSNPDYDYYDYDYTEDQASSRPAVISKNHKAELQAEVSPDRR